MSVIEQIIRASETQDVGPTPFVQPGTVGVPPVIVKVGLKGGGPTFNGKLTYQCNTKLGAVHDEKPSTSVRLNGACASAASKGSAEANS